MLCGFLGSVCGFCCFASWVLWFAGMSFSAYIDDFVLFLRVSVLISGFGILSVYTFRCFSCSLVVCYFRCFVDIVVYFSFVSTFACICLYLLH